MRTLLFSLLLPLFFAASVAFAGTTGQLFADEAMVPFDMTDVKAAQVIVYKSERRMDLLDKSGNVLRTYLVSLGKTPEGHKQKEGDGKTPEGRYIIDARNENSKFHLSLRISYPDASDRSRAKKNNVSPGGGIFIHGTPNGKGWMRWKYNKNKDWTDGCIAVYNFEIREIWDLVPDGTPILIKP